MWCLLGVLCVSVCVVLVFVCVLCVGCVPFVVSVVWVLCGWRVYVFGVLYGSCVRVHLFVCVCVVGVCVLCESPAGDVLYLLC